MGTVQITVDGKNFLFYKKDLLYYNNYPDSLWRGILAGDTEVKIGKINFTFKKDTELDFYMSGKIGSGYLSVDTPVMVGKRKLSLGAGMRIVFHESGVIQEGYLSVNTQLNIGMNSVRLKKGEEEIEVIKFHENGGISQGCLSEPTECKTVKYQVMLFTRIGFFPDGELEWGSLYSDTKLQIRDNTVVFAGSEYYTIEFFQNGLVSSGYLKDIQTIIIESQKIKFQYNISFYENGYVKMGVLAEDTKINGENYSSGKPVVFQYDANGRITGVERYEYPER